MKVNNYFRIFPFKVGHILLKATDTLLSSGQVLINKLQEAAYGLNFSDIPEIEQNELVKDET